LILVPGELIQVGNKLMAPSPDGQRTLNVYNSLDELISDYDFLNDGDEVYIKQDVFIGPEIGKQFAVGGKRGSIIAATAGAAALMLILKIILVAVIVAGAFFIISAIKKSPVTSTKKLNGSTVVTAPDGTTWIVNDATGEITAESKPIPGWMWGIGFLIGIGGTTYVGVKYIAPRLGEIKKQAIKAGQKLRRPFKARG
jgi:hypothetical protein